MFDLSTAIQKPADSKKLDSIIFATMFAIFSFGMLLPMMYGIGKPFYAAVNMELPLVTLWIMKIPPLGMIGLALGIVLLLWTARYFVNNNVSRSVDWTAIVAIAILTLFATFAFLSPLYSVVSGLGGT